MSRIESLNRILRNLQAVSPDIEASALVSDDGLMIASALPQHLDEFRISAMTATLSTLGMRASIELERGDVEEVIVRGKLGYIIFVTASDGTLLLVVTGKLAKLGLVLLDMRRAVEEIRKTL